MGTTILDWPVKVQGSSEFPAFAAENAQAWMAGAFGEYCFISSPKRSCAPGSYPYLFGYGGDALFYQKESDAPVTLHREQIRCVEVTYELMNAVITLHYRQEQGSGKLEFPYVPATYYLFDPFLNWLLEKEPDFVPVEAERSHPRPEKLYHDSLPMFNYSLAAYRLGSGFDAYRYRAREYRHKWMPWRKLLEEWLEIDMERGRFRLHSIGYRTEYTYELHRSPDC